MRPNRDRKTRAMQAASGLQHTVFTVILIVAGVPFLTRQAAAEELHQTIDRLIKQSAPDTVFAEPASDSEFLRRVYLDLAGRIPTVKEARAFLEDSSPGKRVVLVDQLLSGTDYPRRMQELFHVMLMERRGDNEDWIQFLRYSFENNLPWHQLAAAILKPDADNENLRGAAFFHTQRLVKEGAMAPVDVPGLTRDVGRLFAGIDLQCAQCHDHLTVDDYSQRDFQGLHMVFENVDIRRDVKFPAIGEKLMTAPKEYSSVFEQVAMQTGPVIPGRGEVEITVFEDGQEYEIPPDKKKKIPGVPKFSALNELASGLASEDNDLFCRNITNRLWFQMMGRGLVEPLDLHHTNNPATHPELLTTLAREFAKHEFNIRWLLRELALSQTYQRSNILPRGTRSPPETSYAAALEKRLSAEQIFWSLATATGEFNAVRHTANAANIDKSVDTAATSGEASADSVPSQPQTAEQLVAASDDLKELKTRILETFSNPAKEPETDFNPTVAGALFLMHSEQVLNLLEPRPGNLMQTLVQHASDEELIEDLFLAVLTRLPSAEERTRVGQLLENEDRSRQARIRNLTWALLTSSEFMVNH